MAERVSIREALLLLPEDDLELLILWLFARALPDLCLDPTGPGFDIAEIIDNLVEAYKGKGTREYDAAVTALARPDMLARCQVLKLMEKYRVSGEKAEEIRRNNQEYYDRLVSIAHRDRDHYHRKPRK